MNETKINIDPPTTEALDIINANKNPSEYDACLRNVHLHSV